MITPQDIRETQLEKAYLGGYVMDPVDDLLEECAASIEELQAKHQDEIRVLRNKMKILADTVTEYRNNEDAIRNALLSAQKAGAEVELEAKAKGDAIIAEAREAADKILGSVKIDLVLEEARLAEAKKRTAEFVENMRLLFGRQMEFYNSIEDFRLSDEAEALDEADDEPDDAEEIEVLADEPDDVVEEIDVTADEAGDDEEIGVSDDEPDDAEDFEAPDEEAPDADSEPTKPYRIRELPPDEATPRPKFKFDDIQFGENYDSKK